MMRGSAFFRKRHSPAPPLQNLFGGFLLAGADVKPTPQRNGRHIKKRGEDFCKSPLPAPSFKNFKAFCGWRKALYSWHKLPPPHRSEPRRHDTPRAKPCLPDTAAQNLVSPCPRFLRYTTDPRNPPCRGDHWSPANTAPPVNGRRRFYPSFFRAASAAAVPAASPIAQQSAVTR